MMVITEYGREKVPNPYIVLVTDHFCDSEVLWDTCFAGALPFIKLVADEHSLKRAMCLGSARLIIVSISRRSKPLDLVITGVSSTVSSSSSSRNSAP